MVSAIVYWYTFARTKTTTTTNTTSTVQGFPVSYDSKAIMTVSSRGGDCQEGCVHKSYNLYEDGSFQEHKNLSESQVTQLTRLIAETDFTKYQSSDGGNCKSAVDGVDKVLIFPQKYGSRQFIPCEMGATFNDGPFREIQNLIDNSLLGS